MDILNVLIFIAFLLILKKNSVGKPIKKSKTEWSKSSDGVTELKWKYCSYYLLFLAFELLSSKRTSEELTH